MRLSHDSISADIPTDHDASFVAPPTPTNSRPDYAEPTEAITTPCPEAQSVDRGLGPWSSKLVQPIVVHVDATSSSSVRMTTEDTDSPKITVGYDGSDGAVAALRWASSEALHRGGILQIVTCWNSSHDSRPLDRLLPDPRPVYETAEWLMQSQSGREPGPRTQFTFSVLPGLPEHRFAAESTSSDLLVIGTAGHLLLGAWRLGSIAHEILRHARCPVVLVPAGHIPASHRRVVVGVEDATSGAALAWAATEAGRRKAELVIVHAQQGEDTAATDRARSIIAESVHFAAQQCDAEISTRLVQGPPATSLLAQAFNADLLVVGTRTTGHGDDKPGSIARAVGACATSPTVIVQPASNLIDPRSELRRHD